MLCAYYLLSYFLKSVTELNFKDVSFEKGNTFERISKSKFSEIKKAFSGIEASH